MIRARFKANEDDYRSFNWPVKHPYWCSGYGDGCSIVVAYADDEAEILTNWPEARDINTEDVDRSSFSGRFPRPTWFTPPDEDRFSSRKTGRLVAANGAACRARTCAYTGYDGRQIFIANLLADEPKRYRQITLPKVSDLISS